MKPTKEQVLAWARDIFDAQNWSDVQLSRLKELSDRAYAAGAAAMKERAAKVCEAESSDPAMPESYSNNHMGGWADGCDACAAAIRALGDDE